MKRRPFLFLVLPLALGAFYLRSLASWRPRKVFQGTGAIEHFVFSHDGKTLAIVNAQPPHISGSVITAFQTQDRATPIWRSEVTTVLGHSPQFFGNDSQIFQEGQHHQVLNAVTGRICDNGNPNYFHKRGLSPANSYDTVISSTGKWLAYHAIGSLPEKTFIGGLCVIATDKTLPTPSGVIPSQRIPKRFFTSDAFAFSPDGNTFVAGVSDSGGAHLDFYDVKTWRRSRLWSDVTREFFRHPTLPIYSSIQWSRNGLFLLSSWTAPQGKYFKVWRVSDGALLTSSRSPFLDTNLIPEVQNDGRVLRFDGKGTLYLGKSLIPHSGGQQLFCAPSESISAATISPDGAYLLVGTQSGRVYRQRLK